MQGTIKFDENGDQYTEYIIKGEVYRVWNRVIDRDGTDKSFEKYLAENNISPAEWWRGKEEEAMSRIYGCKVKTTIAER